MIHFFLFSLFILMCSLIRIDRQLLIFIFIGCTLFILSGYRDISVGTDTIGYFSHFETISSGYIIPVEPGWIYLNQFISTLGGTYETFMIFISALILFPLLFIIYKTSNNPIFSVFLYYTTYLYFYSFNITRQALAITIVFLSFFFLLSKKKKILIPLGLILLASTLHTSALIALPILVADKIPDKKWFYYSGISLTSFIGLFLTPEIANIISKIEYDRYFELRSFGNLSGNMIYLIILNSFFLFIYLTLYSRNILFKIFFLYIILSNLFIRLPFTNRVVMYYTAVLIIFFPYYLYHNKVRQSAIIFSIIILYAYILFFRTFGAGEIIPYTNRLIEGLIIK